MNSIFQPVLFFLLSSDRFCRCWDDAILGLHYDEKISQWLRTFLESDDEIDLVVFDEKQFSARPSKDKPDFPNVARDYDMAVYHDVCPNHLCSLESLADLNSRLENPVKIYNFRPNIVVKTLDKPYAEVKYNVVVQGKKSIFLF